MVGLLARGLQTKQIARALGISSKTADRRVQNSYAKIGVSTPCRSRLVRHAARGGSMGRTPDDNLQKRRVTSPPSDIAPAVGE